MTTDSFRCIECEQPWFSLLRNRAKRFTGRKNSPKYQGIRPGDPVEMFCGNESFTAKVSNVRKFQTIEEYLRAVSVEKALPGIETFEEALTIYSRWSTPEEVGRWGFIAIYITI